MSRGYDDYDYEPDYENAWALAQQATDRAIKGKRGQKLLRELAASMDAMPCKRLVRGNFQTFDDEVCALGVLGRARGVDMTELNRLAKEADEDDYMVEPLREEAAKTFGVANSLASVIMDTNDQTPYAYEMRNGQSEETPEERWMRMRAWVQSKIREPAS